MEDCALITGNAMKLCNAEAMAKQKIDLVTLEGDSHPTMKDAKTAKMDNIINAKSDNTLAP